MKTLNVFAELNELRKNWRDWSVIFRAPTPKFQNLFMNMTKNQEFFFMTFGLNIWQIYEKKTTTINDKNDVST